MKKRYRKPRGRKLREHALSEALAGANELLRFKEAVLSTVSREKDRYHGEACSLIRENHELRQTLEKATEVTRYFNVGHVPSSRDEMLRLWEIDGSFTLAIKVDTRHTRMHPKGDKDAFLSLIVERLCSDLRKHCKEKLSITER